MRRPTVPLLLFLLAASVALLSWPPRSVAAAPETPAQWLAHYADLADAAPAHCLPVRIPRLPDGIPARAFPQEDLPAAFGKRVIYTQDPIVEHFIVLAQGADGCVFAGESGRALPFGDRSLPSPLANTLIPAQLGPQPPVAIVADAKVSHPRIGIEDAGAFSHNAAQAWVWLGAFAGMLGVLLLVGIGFALSQRGTLARAYVLYLCGLLLYQLQAFGLGFAWLPFWPGPEYSRLMQGLGTAALMLGSGSMVIAFLHARWPVVTAIAGLVGLSAAMFLMSVWFMSAYPIALVSVLAFTVLSLAVLVGRLRTKDPAARWFAFGLAAAMIAGLVQSSTMLRGIALPGIAGMTVALGNLVESLCWLIALATRNHKERQAMQDRLRHEATHDSLTGVYGRSFLRKEIQQLIDQAGSDPRRRCGLLFVDLDGFKRINDSLGHAMGDKVLIAVAQALVDLKLDSQVIGRFGGDEYLVLIRSGAHWSVTEGAAAAVVGRFRDPVEVDGRSVSIAASVGVVPITADYHDVDQVVHDADTALYVAKARGGGRYVLFEPALRKDAQQREQLRSDLGDALRLGQIVLHYQPVFELDSLRPIGFEALVRWQHPSAGTLTAAQFLPLAREIGLTRELGARVIDLAFRQVSQWQKAGLWRHGEYVSINVGARQLADEILLEQLDRAFARYPVDPSSLRVELSEAALARDPDQARRLVTRLLGRNILVGVDGFGAGLCPLPLLNELQFDQIKLDASIVAGVAHLGRSQGLARAALALGTELSSLVVAEGIEDRQQLAMLQSLGYAYGQGPLFAAAMPAKEVALWVDLWQDQGGRAGTQPQDQRQVH